MVLDGRWPGEPNLVPIRMAYNVLQRLAISEATPATCRYDAGQATDAVLRESVKPFGSEERRRAWLRPRQHIADHEENQCRYDRVGLGHVDGIAEPVT